MWYMIIFAYGLVIMFCELRIKEKQFSSLYKNNRAFFRGTRNKMDISHFKNGI